MHCVLPFYREKKKYNNELHGRNEITPVFDECDVCKVERYSMRYSTGE